MCYIFVQVIKDIKNTTINCSFTVTAFLDSGIFDRKTNYIELLLMTKVDL